MTVTLDGVNCPLVTPFADGEVDAESLARLVETLADAGIDGFVPCGTTGEFASLTDEERRLVVETTVDAAPEDATVVAGAGDTSVAAAADRVDTVVGLGADAALLPPPYFHAANDAAGLGRFFDDVLSETAGDVVLYNFPGPTGQTLSPDLVARLAERERVVGLKDSSGDFGYVLDVLDRVPDGFPVALGPDRLLGPGVDAGAAGGVNGLSNVLPETMLAVYDAHRDGAAARGRALMRERGAPILDRCRTAGYVSTLKALLSARGVLASAAVRPPLSPVDPRDVAGADRGSNG
jgi:4-hydroxy-tetrahydrodipicolinate synthase